MKTEDIKELAKEIVYDVQRSKTERDAVEKVETLIRPFLEKTDPEKTNPGKRLFSTADVDWTSYTATLDWVDRHA